MAELIAIGYPDMATAAEAMNEVERLAADLIIEPDAIAAIVRDPEGKFRITTNHHAVGTGATYGMFWGLLFGVLFFIPFFGMALGGSLGALIGKFKKAGIDSDFKERVRHLMKPGSSALFLVVDKGSPDKAVAALSRFGGTVLQSSLATDAHIELQSALHGRVPT